MAGRKKKAGGGVPEWLVTFADLMSILVCFFVLIISFSVQDKERLQIVAGSMREAFGIRTDIKLSGVLELEGRPIREFLKDVSIIDTEDETNIENENEDFQRIQGQEDNTRDDRRSNIEIERQFASAVATLRQAWQDLPEIAALSKNIVLEETEEGLNIHLVDQEGRSMFAEGSRIPYQTVKTLLASLAPALERLPNRIRLTGHTTAGQLYADPSYTGWELSADRANVARMLLVQSGLSTSRLHSVIGRADAQPLFPNDPFLTANRRISILLMKEEPPLPLGDRL
ncbi:MAG: flagellar motor protein MotB [Pseudomonadota bacterium]